MQSEVNCRKQSRYLLYIFLVHEQLLSGGGQSDPQFSCVGIGGAAPCGRSKTSAMQ